MTSTHGALGRFAGTLSRHTALLGIAAVNTFVMGVITLAVLTRLLDVGDFGRLALLLFLAALLTVVYNAGSLQGTFMYVFGASAEEGVVDEDENAKEASAGVKRRALGSALLLTALIGAAGTAVVASLAEPIAEALLGRPALADSVRLAAISAGFGSLWRLITNVLRYERRPGAFVALSAARPVLVLGCTVPLVATGGGIEGAVGGVALGTVLAVVLGLAVTRRSYAPAFNRADIRRILTAGMAYVPLVMAFWVLHSADIYIVSIFGSDAQVAFYRVASRIGAGVGYFVSAFVMAWVPLMRTALHQATVREHGASETSATVFGWFAVACLWIVLALAVLADVLIHVAPEEYAGAAPLIPLVGLSFVAYGAMVLVYYGTQLPNKRRRYVVLALTGAVGFVALALALTPTFGGYGVVLSQIVVFALATANLVWAARRAGKPFPLQWALLMRALAVALVLLVAGLAAGPALGTWRIALDISALVLYPGLLVLTGVISRDNAARVLEFVGRRPRRPPSRGRAVEALTGLEHDERRMLELLLRRGEPVPAVAATFARDERALLGDVVGALRRAAGAGPPSPEDHQIGAYLLVGSNDAVAERDVCARALWRNGAIDPLDVDVLERFARRLRQAPARHWVAFPDAPPSPEPRTRRRRVVLRLPVAVQRLAQAPYRAASDRARRALGRAGRPTFGELVTELGLPRESRVIDLGAGGFVGQTTTRHLVERFDPPVVAVERDPDRAAALRKRFGERVDVVVEDAFTFTPEEPADLLVADLDSGAIPRLYEELLPRARAGLLRPGGTVVSVLVGDHALAYGGGRALPVDGAEPMAAFLRRTFGGLRVTEERLGTSLRGMGWELVGLHPKYAGDRGCYVHWVVLRDRDASPAPPGDPEPGRRKPRGRRRPLLARARRRMPGHDAREVRRLIAEGRTMAFDLVAQRDSCDRNCAAMVDTWTRWAQNALGGTLDPKRTFGPNLEALAGPHVPWTELVVPRSALALLPVLDAHLSYRESIGRKARTALRKAERLGYESRTFSRNDHLDEISEINASKAIRAGGPMSHAYLDPPRPGAAERSGGCSVHRTVHVGAFLDGRLRAYAQLELVGELAILNTILGHADALPDGVMVRLVEGLVAVVAEAGDARAIDYLRPEASAPSLERFKRSVGFRAHAVLLRGARTT